MRAFVSFLISATLAFSVTAEPLPLKAAIFELDQWGFRRDDTFAGAVPEIITALELELKQPIQKTLVAYPRMLKMIETGDADFAIFFQSAKSKKLAEQLIKLYELKTILLVTKPTGTPPIPPRKLRVAVPRGVYFDSPFDTSTEYQKIISNNHFHSVQLMLAGRVDGIAAAEIYILSSLRLAGKSMADYKVAKRINTNEVWLQFSKKSDQAAYKGRLVESIATLHDKGIITRIIEKNLSQQRPVPVR